MAVLVSINLEQVRYRASLEAICSAFPNSLPLDVALPGAFQAYWRGVFAQLHERIDLDGSIPEQLTSPPSPALWVDVFAQGLETKPTCPRYLPEVKPSIKLENDVGVTKGDPSRGWAGFCTSYRGDYVAYHRSNE